VEAALSLGYRYLKGVGVPENCPLALNYLELAANVAIEQANRRGYVLFMDRSRISSALDGTKKGIDNEVSRFVF